MVIEIGWGRGRAVLFEIRCGRVKVHVHVEQFALDEIGLAGRPQAQRAFRLELEQIVFAVIERDVGVQFRIEIGKRLHARREPPCAERDWRRDA